MPKLIHNKNELEQFNIGFEFELFVSKKKLLQPIIKEKQKLKIPDNVLQEYGHLFIVRTTEPEEVEDIDHNVAGNYFLNKLKEHYPEQDWHNMFEVHSDYSLSDTQNHIGVEMVLKHTKGVEAMKNLVKVFSILNLPEFKTTTSCGMHINMSFVDDKKNRGDLVYDIINILNVEPILKDFNRLSNQYCVSNEKTTLNSYYLKQKIAQQIGTLVTGSNSDKHYTLKHFSDITKKLQTPKHMKEFGALVEDSIKSLFLNNWNSERPAIAPKVMYNKNYIEFRTMGGKDYQKKYDKVENGINEFLKALKKVDMLHTNKNIRENKRKMMA